MVSIRAGNIITYRFFFKLDLKETDKQYAAVYQLMNIIFKATWKIIMIRWIYLHYLFIFFFDCRDIY